MPRNNRRVLYQNSLKTITNHAEGLRFLLAFLASWHLKSRLNLPGKLGTHFCLLLSYPIENFCKDMHFFSINQKIWHFFIKISQYFKDLSFAPQRGALLAAKLLYMWLCHVSCPQADVSCTYGAFHAAELRFYCFLCCSPAGG